MVPVLRYAYTSYLVVELPIGVCLQDGHGFGPHRSEAGLHISPTKRNAQQYLTVDSPNTAVCEFQLRTAIFTQYFQNNQKQIQIILH